MFANTVPLYSGHISDYIDIIELYHSKKINYDEYVKRFNDRARTLETKERVNNGTYYNKDIIIDSQL